MAKIILDGKVREFDGAYLIGRDINGRQCRVAFHRTVAQVDLCDKEHPVTVKSGGHTYKTYTGGDL